MVSKKGKYLNETYIDYIKNINRFSYSIIPYGFSENEYYFAIITKEGSNIICKKYKYISNENRIDYINDHYYTAQDDTKNNISCELIYYNNDKVFFCIYGSWYILILRF